MIFWRRLLHLEWVWRVLQNFQTCKLKCKCSEAYVDGNVHTNKLENFWSLLKRAIKGTYVNVEPFHLFHYLDEQSFRYNERKLNDGECFQQVLG
ncbi:MAG TPA: transposase [Terriglobia bacterium]|nr:transposase [Terriglobia bacterium]